jgi:hypothetical protein
MRYRILLGLCVLATVGLLDAQSGSPASPPARPHTSWVEVGSRVTLPGEMQFENPLGRLGVLPKMDFGLELLYGAAEPRPADPPATSSGDEELTIRGSLKHRF